MKHVFIEAKIGLESPFLQLTSSALIMYLN